MLNPFPGMNPYLEQPELWHQAHNCLIVAIADELTPQIRQKILSSTTNLIEIDLLRGGEAMPVLEKVYAGYRILVSRGSKRPEADLYTFGLKEAIPAFPVPLIKGEVEPVIDLQRLLNEVFERARFDLSIDYSQKLKPVLTKEEEVWVKEITSLAK